jgi:hypothetical protein
MMGVPVPSSGLTVPAPPVDAMHANGLPLT